MIPVALQKAFELLGAAQHLSAVQSRDAVSQLLAPSSDPILNAAFLTALHLRGINSEELTGAVDAVKGRMEPLEVHDSIRPLLDTCGTGGDGVNSVNISTASAIVVAACGVRVAKHGNRSATGNSGSAEVLAELGVKYDAEPTVLIRCLEHVGITFLFAPRFHPALKALAPVRKTLPFRTIFNLLGPLVNPVFPDAQMIGAAGRERALLLAGALRNHSSDLAASRSQTPTQKPENSRDFRAFMVTGEDGLDEVTLSGDTYVFELIGRDLREFAWRPSDFALPRTHCLAISVTGPADSAAKIRSMLAGERGPVRDVVLANVAAALKLMGKVDSVAEGVVRGAEAIDRRDATKLLDRWVEVSHS